MKQDLEQAITELVARQFDVNIEVELTRPEERFGDYATNIALQLAKQVGKSPREIAEQLASLMTQEFGDQVSDVQIAGPGFINISLSDRRLLTALRARPALGEGHKAQRVVIETNNPNPFKAMHIGHAFNAITGDTLANLLEAAGHEVHRVGYHGDVGSHVGKSMWAILHFCDGDSSKLQLIPSAERNSFMSDMYAKGAQAYKTDETIKTTIDALSEQSFVLDDPLYRAIYETCKQWSFELLDQTIARLGCRPTEKKYLESVADPIGVSIVKNHLGKVFQASQGALVFDGQPYGSFLNVFVSSRGRGLYAARDLGLMQLKHIDYDPDKSYIVTAEEQKSYFIGVIAAAELCFPETKDVTRNISTGTVKLSSGKMSSRDGNVLDINWLFEQMEQAVVARGAIPSQDVIAGALRYEFLRARIGGDIIFDIDEAVSITGNSGPYLQYAHARARSILVKANSLDIADDPKAASSFLEQALQPDERSLVRKVTEYNEVCAKAFSELLPHYLTNYLYELAQGFNRFYEHNRVVGDERQAIRLMLVALYAETLRQGLELLGIVAPQTM